jgi:hypothetical protein
LRQSSSSALDLGHFLQGLDAAQAQVVGGDVEHGADVAALVAEPAPQQAAARGFQDRGVDRGIAQDHLGRHRTCHVALHGQLAVDVDPVGRGQPHRVAAQLEDMGDHAGGRGLAVGSGDRRDGNPARRARRKEHVHDRPRHVAGIRAEEVDAAHVETDRLDRAHRHLAVVGMHDVGHVDGGATGREVGGRAQIDHLAGRRHARGRVVALFQQLMRLAVELDPGQDLLVADAALRVAVHFGDQLLDGHRAVAHHMAGHPLGHGDQLAVDHQHAVVEAFDEAFDDDRPAAAVVLQGVLEGGRHCLAVGQPDRDAPAVVGVERLDDHRVADAFGGAHRVFRDIDQALAGYRQAEIGQDLDGLLLVGGQLDGDVMGFAGDRGLDAPLETSVAQLDQAAVVEADPGNVALARGLDQRGRTGAERAALRETDEVVPFLVEVEVRPPVLRGDQLLGQQVMQQIERQAPGLQPDQLLLVLVDHVIDAGFAVASGLAEAHLGPGDVLKLDRGVLPDVAHPGPLVLAQPAHEAARLAVGTTVLVQARQGLQEAADESLAQAAGRPFLEHADIDPVPDHRKEGIDIGASIDRGIEDLHRRSPCLSPAFRGGFRFFCL